MSLRGLRRWWRSLASVSPYEEEELVSLDLETSSLDPRSAEVLSIAAVPVRGRQVVLSERFERIVRASAPVDREAVKFHRLLPTDVEHGLPPQQAATEFVDWLGERPLLGYCIGFDCLMLERAAQWGGSGLLDNRRFDIREVYRRRRLQRNPDENPAQALDEILAVLDVPRIGRHTAVGDATAVGLAFLALKYASARPAPRRQPA
ncbi:MAG: exonuclease domain-containing protein [Steroidobacteraceae bacterium]|nr:exonuclease domain-containing protein [Steroidobacteraceae bacterium]